MCQVLTENDIARRYQKASKKGQQIRIMADLNDCSVQEIKEILQRNGIETMTATIKKNIHSKMETKAENTDISKDAEKGNVSNMNKNKEMLVLPGHVMAALTDKIDQLQEQEKEITNKISELTEKLHSVQDAQVEIEQFIEEFNK